MTMNLLIRVLWFVFVGWWLGLLWLTGAILLMLSILFFPFGAYLATKTWTVMTLKSKPRTIANNVSQEVTVNTGTDEN